MKKRGLKYLLSAAIFLAAVIPFIRSYNYSFLDYDDQLYVIENVHMRDGLTGSNIAWAFKSCGYAFNWHPLTWISLMSDVTLWGGTKDDKIWNCRTNGLARVMHVHNLVLHGVNAVLLFLILLTFVSQGDRNTLCQAEGVVNTEPSNSETSQLLLCAALALSWAVHPLRTEVVCWVAERKELLSVFFMLLSLLAYFHAGRAVVSQMPNKSDGAPPLSSTVNGIKWGGYLTSLICFVLALLAKPVAVTLPVVVLAWDWLMQRRSFGTAFIRSLPFAAFSFGACVLTLLAQTDTMETGASMGLASRFFTSFAAPLVYLKQTIWPLHLSAFYRPHDAFAWGLIVPGILLVLLMVAVSAWGILRRGTWATDCAFALSWLYVGLLPMLGIVKAGTEEHSDRYTYWVGCGLIVLVFLSWDRIRELFAKSGVRLNTALFVKGLFLLAIGLGYLSYQRSSVWRDTECLFRDALPKCWQSGVAIALANNLKDGGQEARAEGEAILRRTMTENPDAKICGALAVYLAAGSSSRASFTGDDKADPWAEVRYLVDRSLSGDPKNVMAYEALGLVEVKSGNWKKALAAYTKAQEVYPQKDYSAILSECRAKAEKKD